LAPRDLIGGLQTRFGGLQLIRLESFKLFFLF
jgi:hypothetical protein